MTYLIDDILEYSVIVISEFAKRFLLTPKQAFSYIKHFGGLNLIENHYGIMHTLSFEEAVDSVAIYCNKNGGLLK